MVPSTLVKYVDSKHYRKPISSYTARQLMREEDSIVLHASINQLRKVVLIVIRNLFILGRNSNAQSVTIRQLRKVVLNVIGHLFIWVRNFNAKNVTMRQIGKVIL